MLQGVMDRLKGARELTIKRLYKLVLRKALGNFLAGQLGVEQLDVRLVVEDGGPTRQGLVQLTDLEINAEALNSYLEKQPLKMLTGRVGKVEVSVCYEKLLKEGFKITLEEVDVVLVRRLRTEQGEDSLSSSSSSAQAAETMGEGKNKTAATDNGLSGARRGMSSFSSLGGGDDMARTFLGGAPPEDGGTSIIAEWIEQITTQMRVEVKGLRVRVLEGPTSTGPGLRVSVNSARYEDVTAKYQGIGLMQASVSASMSGSTFASAPSCISLKRVCFEGLQIHVERGGLEGLSTRTSNSNNDNNGSSRRVESHHHQRCISAKEEYRILEAASEGQVDIKLGHSSRPAEVAKLDLRVQMTKARMNVSPKIIKDMLGLTRIFTEGDLPPALAGNGGPVTDFGPFFTGSALGDDEIPDVGELDFREIENVLKQYASRRGLTPLGGRRGWELEDEDFFDCEGPVDSALLHSMHDNGGGGEEINQGSSDGNTNNQKGGKASLRLRVDAVDGCLRAYATDEDLASNQGAVLVCSWAKLYAASGAVAQGRFSTVFSLNTFSVLEHCTKKTRGNRAPQASKSIVLLGFEPPILPADGSPPPPPLEGTIELRSSDALKASSSSSSSPSKGGTEAIIVDLKLQPIISDMSLGSLKWWLRAYLDDETDSNPSSQGSSSSHRATTPIPKGASSSSSSSSSSRVNSSSDSKTTKKKTAGGMRIRLTCPRVRLTLPFSAAILDSSAITALRKAYELDPVERGRWEEVMAVLSSTAAAESNGSASMAGKGGEKDRLGGFEIRMGGGQDGWIQEGDEGSGDVVLDLNADGNLSLRLGAVYVAVLLNKDFLVPPPPSSSAFIPLSHQTARKHVMMKRLHIAKVLPHEGIEPFIRLSPYEACQGFASSLNRTLAPPMREWEAVDRDGDMLAGKPRPLPTADGPLLHLHLPDVTAELTHVERLSIIHLVGAVINEPLPDDGAGLKSRDTTIVADNENELQQEKQQDSKEKEQQQGNIVVPVLVSCGSTVIVLHETATTALDPAVRHTPHVFTTIFDGLCLYSLSSPSTGSHFRVTASDLTLAEAESEASGIGGDGLRGRQIPALYKNKWVPRSEEAEPPLVVLELIKKAEAGGGPDVLSAYLDLYGVALRFRVESQWLPRVVAVMAGGVETLAESIRGGDSSGQKVDGEEKEAEEDGSSKEKLANVVIDGKTEKKEDSNCCSVMRIFCTAFDSIIDYASDDAGGYGARAVLSFGLARVSSTLVQGAVLQAYKVMLRDLVLHMSGAPAHFGPEDEALLGASLLDLAARPKQQEQSDYDHSWGTSPGGAVGREWDWRRGLGGPVPTPPETAATTYGSVQQFLEQKGFVQLATLNFVDASVRCRTTTAALPPPPTLDAEAGGGITPLPPPPQVQIRNREPALTLDLSIGLLLIYTCGDSFMTLQETAAGCWCRMTTERERMESLRLGKEIDRKPSHQPNHRSDSSKHAALPASSSSSSSPAAVAPTAISPTKGSSSSGEIGEEEGDSEVWGVMRAALPPTSEPKFYLEDIDEEMFVPVAGDRGVAGGRGIVASSHRPKQQQGGNRGGGGGTGGRQGGTGGGFDHATEGGGVANPQGLCLGQMLIDDFYEMNNVSAPLSRASAAPLISDVLGAVKEGEVGMGKEIGLAPEAEGEEKEECWAGWLDQQGGRGDGSGGKNHVNHILDEGFLVEVDEFDGTSDTESMRGGEGESGRYSSLGSVTGDPSDAEYDDDQLSVNLKLDPGVPGDLFAGRGGRLRRMTLDGMEFEMDPLNALEGGGREEEGGGPVSAVVAGEDDEDQATDLAAASSTSSVTTATPQAASSAAVVDSQQQEPETNKDPTTPSSSSAAAATATTQIPPPPRGLPPAPGVGPEGDDAGWAWHSEVTPEVEQRSQWFVDGIRIYPHHVPLAQGGEAAFAGEGKAGEEGGGDEGEASRGRISSGSGGGVSGGGGEDLSHLQFRLLLHDISVRWRMFAGTDWGEQISLEKESHLSSSGSEGTSTGHHATSEHLKGLLGEGGGETTWPGLSATGRSNGSGSNTGSKGQRLLSAGGRKRSGSSTSAGRKVECMVEVCLSHVSARVDSFVPGETRASSTFLRVLDFHVLDRINTVQPRRILGYWRSDAEHPRDSKDHMLDLELTALLPSYDATVGPTLNRQQAGCTSEGGTPVEELVLRARLLPLRGYVDQHTIDFLTSFFALAAAVAHPVGPEEAVEAPLVFFQSIQFRRVKVKLDTKTRALDVREVQKGNYAELINICPLKGVKLELQPVQLRGMSGWGAVLEGIRDSWVSDVTQKQIHRILMGPSAIRSVFNVGSGVADLVLVPLRQYRKDGRLLRGLRKGAIRCLRNITIEALNASVGITRAVATTLNELVTEVPVGRRLLEPDPQPRGVRDSLEHAYDSLSRGLNTAAHTIIAIPIQELERSGPRGSVRAVFRALPIAVVKPVVGATEALSITLLGVRNKIDPLSRREEEELWRV